MSASMLRATNFASALGLLFALSACGSSKEQELAECKLSGEHTPGGQIGMEIHLANCMTVAGYTLIEAKVGQPATTPIEKECFADWDAAHFMPQCYRRQ